ncbi:MAG TPA: hypothetical protein VGG14_04405 [Candidatus Sulfotelmatobacter sp.]|jgi:hypothetical protein
MAGSIVWRLLVAFSLILAVAASRAQDAAISPNDLSQGLEVRSRNALAPPVILNLPTVRGGPVLHVLPRMIQSAGIIFSGQVVSVTHAEAASGELATPTVITFQVQHAIRGAMAGQKLTIREWAGLWNRGERYRIGERVFLFLYPPSRLGLTSPVKGQLGRLAMDPQERILLRPEITSEFAPDLVFERKDAIPYVDFRRGLQRIGYGNE